MNVCPLVLPQDPGCRRKSFGSLPYVPLGFRNFCRWTVMDWHGICDRAKNNPGTDIDRMGFMTIPVNPCVSFTMSIFLMNKKCYSYRLMFRVSLCLHSTSSRTRLNTLMFTLNIHSKWCRSSKQTPSVGLLFISSAYLLTRCLLRVFKE